MLYLKLAAHTWVSFEPYIYINHLTIAIQISDSQFTAKNPLVYQLRILLFVYPYIGLYAFKQFCLHNSGDNNKRKKK